MSPKTSKKKTLKPSPGAKPIASHSDIKIKPSDTRILPFLDKHRRVLVCVLLVAVTLVVYWPVQDYDFIVLDDNLYIYENRYIQNGFSFDSLKWAFINTIAGMWIPVTWISFMVDSQLWGLSPGGLHIVNLFFHLANIAFLFFLLEKLTGDFWPSAFVATLFALHPIHVESVAWITERKDVLSAFFFFLTIGGYSRYVNQPGVIRYFITFLFFAMGLMAKPMLVTLPFVLLLLDYWPLERFKFGQIIHHSNRSKTYHFFYLVFEKIPFLIFTVLVSVLTYLGTKGVGGIASLESLPVDVRVTNALAYYLKYIGKLLYPANLSVLYPHPNTASWFSIVGTSGLLLGMTWVFIRKARTYPFSIVGWLWYLGMLFPVIGLVHAGTQGMADRFAYLPFIGLYIAIAWSVPALSAGLSHRKTGIAVLSAIVLSIFITTTWHQVHLWENSISLFRHTLKHTDNNYLIHNNLGTVLQEQGNIDDAIKHYREALRIQKDYVSAYDNLGMALLEQGNIDEAIEHFQEALRIEPDFEKAHNSLGIALQKQGNIGDAIEHYREALRIKPDYVKAHNNLGITLQKQGNIDEAIEHFQEALRIEPDFEKAHYNLGLALQKQGNIDDAIEHYREVLRIKPDYVLAHNNLGIAFYYKGDVAMAIRHFEKAIEINPNYFDAKNNLKKMLMLQKNSQ